MTEVIEAERGSWIKNIEWTVVLCTMAILGVVTLALAEPIQHQLGLTIEAWQWAATFGGLCVFAVLMALLKAVYENRFTSTPEKPRDHIDGWGFIVLVAAIAAIVMLADWAASSSSVQRVIQAQWGVFVVVGVAGAFFLAALTPSEEFFQRLGMLVSPITFLVRLLGRLLSGIDALIVFGIAGAAGATRTNPLLRYFLLFGTLLPCAALGYSLEAPWGLVPITWGFVVAVAMSRAWAWVEDDRDLAMLSGKYTGDHLKIGFSQDLKDEALFSFMAMFFLVPLALRQCQLAADLMQVPLFDIRSHVDHRDLGQWIAYYGTELAKAVPFVDWAEVYHVEGNADIAPAERGASRHIVFATRVVVDLVLLAALLQAVSLSARNSKQRDLFKRGEIRLLDPFTEPVEFRKLRRREGEAWIADTALINSFPRYDELRLAELADEKKHPDISCVAIALRKRDGLDDQDRSEEFHTVLRDRANAKRKDASAIDAALSAIQISKAAPNVPVLAEVRRMLNARPAMNGARERIMHMIETAPPSPARDAALRDALEGDHRDTIAAVRNAAVKGLDTAISEGNAWARDLLARIASSDAAQRVRESAREVAARFRPRPA